MQNGEKRNARIGEEAKEMAYDMKPRYKAEHEQNAQLGTIARGEPRGKSKDPRQQRNLEEKVFASDSEWKKFRVGSCKGSVCVLSFHLPWS